MAANKERIQVLSERLSGLQTGMEVGIPALLGARRRPVARRDTFAVIGGGVNGRPLRAAEATGHN